MPLRFVTLTLSLLLALLLAEAGLRAFNYRPGTMDPDMYAANPNPLLPFKLQPNYNGYCAGSEVTTDANGNRRITPSYAELRPGQNPERVVLLLGDSGVFGFGLSDRDTIASQLQRATANKNLNYEIRNIGVSGYTSWNECAALEDYLARSRATDVIVLYMPNDLTFENDYFGIGKGKRAALDRGEGRLPRYTRWLYSHVYVSYLVSDSIKRLGAALRSRGVAQAATGGEFDEEGKRAELDYSMQALRKMKALCDERKISFQVSIYRDLAYFTDPAGWVSYEQAIGRHLDQAGIKWFITKSHIDQLSPGEIRVAWNDVHPSPRAAGLIAEDVLEAVK